MTHHRHNETLPGELSWGRRTTGAVDGREGTGLGERDTCDGAGVSQHLQEVSVGLQNSFKQEWYFM